MIEIVSLEEEITDERLQNLSSGDVYVTSLDMISSLLSMKRLPLKNHTTAIRNILEFLRYSDLKMEETGDTLLELHRDTLNRFFNMNQRVKYMEILREKRVLTRVPHPDGSFYQPGKESSLYRFHNEYVFAELCLVIIPRKRYPVHNITSVPKGFQRALRDSTFNYTMAIRDEITHCGTEKDRLRKRINRLLLTLDDRSAHISPNTGRIFHSFSSVSRVSRKHMHVEGNPYHSLDVTNCQPILLCALLRKNELSIDERYLSDCEEGILYERFIGITGKFSVRSNGHYVRKEMTLDRDNVKLQLYRSVYFSLDEKNPVNIRFRELYPVTYESLSSLVGEGTSAVLLQSMESSIFNPLRPKKSTHYFTLFDSIYFTEESDRETLTSDILYRFSQLGVKARVK